MNKPVEPQFTVNPPETVGDPLVFQRLLKEETVPVPDYLESVPPKFTDEDLDASRYTSREFHRLEAERMWTKTWQFVIREEEIPKAGDHVIYDIIDKSIIVMRGDDGKIRGFYNSCLHRGRALRTQSGCAGQLKCPFHGFTWDIQGRFKSKPCEWDFQHLEGKNLELPQVRCESWAGFVFINFDMEAKPLMEYLGVVPDHFKNYNMDRSYSIAHVQRRIPCNWKVGQEAFFEAMHTKATHPGIMTFTDDVDSQYDVYDDHVARAITPMGLPSANLSGVDETTIMRDLLAMSGRMSRTDGENFELPEGMSARKFVGELNREAFAAISGDDLSQATIAELEDAILYSIFPNFQVWSGYFGNIVYRFIPDGDDHEHCIFDVYLLGRYAKGTACPPAAPLHRLADDEGFDKAPEIGALGDVFEEDMRNLPHMMKGMKASKSGKVTLASYQESRIRHHHLTLDKYLGIGKGK
jgi:phenylpropionate dioxygenase-like ring-hydroxylating dioxygenase large terminal subunit